MFVISVLAGIKYLMLAAPLAAFLFAMKILRNKVFVLWIINTTSNGTKFGPAASSWQVDSGFTTGFSSLQFTVRLPLLCNADLATCIAMRLGLAMRQICQLIASA